MACVVSNAASRVPPEVLQGILRPSYIHLLENPVAFVESGRSYPMAMQNTRLVSRTWNQVVLDDHKTWSHIILHNDLTIPMLKESIRRCGPVLDLSFHFFMRRPPVIRATDERFLSEEHLFAARDFLRAITPILSTIFHRCTFISAYSLDERSTSSFLRHFENTACAVPKVQSIRLDLAHYKFQWEDPYIFPFGAALPSLTRFSTLTLEPSWGPALANVVTLELGSRHLFRQVSARASIAEVRALFTVVPQLVNLQLAHFVLYDFGWEPINDSAPIQMPYLTHLDVSCSPSWGCSDLANESTCTILALLELPAVTTLRLDGPPKMEHFIHHSGSLLARITTLVLISYHSRDGDFAELLRETPSLVRLDVRGVFSLVRHLTVIRRITSGWPYICPLLRILCIDDFLSMGDLEQRAFLDGSLALVHRLIPSAGVAISFRARGRMQAVPVLAPIDMFVY
ncbi:hypothetical protein C8R46DRAFT_1221073 [Mycena filopes]|nr:hypothetical protein C8R46DRAFT_1221073 [Mycena filopes]